MSWWILPVDEFYVKLTHYMTTVGLPWDARDEAGWKAEMAEEIRSLGTVMGKGEGRSVLDCSCGWGRQAVPLAKLGWSVTATDLSEVNMNRARKRAENETVIIDFLNRDMRNLGFQSAFDWVISCMALYDLVSDADIQKTVTGMFTALKPGGKCYIRLRDHDNVMHEKPRHEFHGERRTPHGRVICIEDWDYEDPTHMIHIYAFLKEDERYEDYRRWETDTLGCRIRALFKKDLQHFLRTAGFEQIDFLPQPSPWHPYAVVAGKSEKER